MSPIRLALVMLLALPATTQAQGLRNLCPDRPGKATPACTLDPGHVEYEASLADWSHDHARGKADDALLIADSLLRIGITGDTEAQIGWTPWERDRARNEGGLNRSSGTGDITLSIRHNLRNPDGKDVSLALQPFISLPTGSRTVSAGDWGAGLTIPASFALPSDVQLALVPTIEAAVNEDGNGRHLAYSLVTSITVPVGSTGISAILELWSQRDHGPSGHISQHGADVVAAWQPRQLANIQLDIGAYLGLDHNTPDAELLGGVAVRF